MRVVSLASGAALVVLGLASPANGLVIDDFEAGPFSLVDTAPGGNEISNLSGLPTANVIGGARYTQTALNDGNSLTATVPSTAGDDALTVTFGIGSNGGVLLAYGWDTPLDVDLASDGGNAIVVSMTAATPTASFLSSALQVGLIDMDFNSGGAALEFTGAGDYVFPFTVFTEFGVDVENIRQILVGPSSAEPAAVRSYAISAVTIGFVPEPTVGVLTLSAVAVGTRRRRR